LRKGGQPKEKKESKESLLFGNEVLYISNENTKGKNEWTRGGKKEKSVR